MNWKGTLLLILLAAATVVGLALSERTRTRPGNQSLITLDPESIERIVIREGSRETVLHKVSGIWKTGSGTPDRADPEAVRRILSAVPDIIPLDTLAPAELKGAVSLQALDLKTPKRSLTFGSGSRGQTICFGAEGAAKGRVYARIQGEAPVHLVPSDITGLAFLPPETFRDRCFTALKAGEISGISVIRPPDNKRLLLRKDGRGWSLAEPIGTGADGDAVGHWIDSLLAAHVENWMPPATDPGICGLTEPSALVTIREAMETQPVTIALGAPVPGTPQDRYATCSDRPGICVLKDATRFLEATPSSLRSRHLSPFQNDAIDRIEISYPGQPTPSVVARRKGGSDWESPGRDSSVAGERVDAWLSGLKELPVSDFQPATADRLAATGLSRPTVIRLIAHLSENTAEEGAGDMVLAEFSLGEPEGGSTAVLEKGSPDLMTVPSARIRPLMEECSSWITPSAPPPAK